jgi:hypothetical protein
VCGKKEMRIIDNKPSRCRSLRQRQPRDHGFCIDVSALHSRSPFAWQNRPVTNVSPRIQEVTFPYESISSINVVYSDAVVSSCDGAHT